MLLVFMKCLLILLILFRYLINLCRTFHNVPINAVGSVGTKGKIEKTNIKVSIFQFAFVVKSSYSECTLKIDQIMAMWFPNKRSQLMPEM